ncbi:MAG TPA: enoyl-CoA hydratase/isomerase family protein [Paracoccaceae bacterium]|nr:enoyl-CoA hydratase/isomerase family protein [Paracoccaceae bacterium]
MADIEIRIEGKAGRITLNRPKALNALSYEMCLAVERALDAWRDDSAVDLILIDAVGEKAFCAGGDIQEMYDTARHGDFSYGRKFWADEYRMNAKMRAYPKPVVSFLQGFTMGGGVGVGCHGSHRIVGESSQIAMPECGIGLVPDVGGSFILSRAPGRTGEYLGTTGQRLNAGDAIFCGFADIFVPESEWEALKVKLVATGDPSAIISQNAKAPAGTVQSELENINVAFELETLPEILAALPEDDWGQQTAKALSRGCPISMACTLEMVRNARGFERFEQALAQEYRFTYRSASDGDFVEGIRAQIIDKDRNPKWALAIGDIRRTHIEAMLAPLGLDELQIQGETS